MSVAISCVGRLAADSEYRTVGDNGVLSFRMAVNGRRGKEDVTTWLSVSYWGGGAEKLKEWTVKGREVFVHGTLTTREYESNGKARTSLEVRADGLRLVGGNKESNEHAKTHASNTDKDDSSEVPF